MGLNHLPTFSPLPLMTSWLDIKQILSPGRARLSALVHLQLSMTLGCFLKSITLKWHLRLPLDTCKVRPQFIQYLCLCWEEDDYSLYLEQGKETLREMN